MARKIVRRVLKTLMTVLNNCLMCWNNEVELETDPNSNIRLLKMKSIHKLLQSFRLGRGASVGDS